MSDGLPAYNDDGTPVGSGGGGSSREQTVYLASSFSLKDRVQLLYEVLVSRGFAVPDVWWDDSREQADLKEIDQPDEEWYRNQRVIDRANRHWRTIDDADVFVLVAPPLETKKFNGANIELGYAIASGCDCYALGRLERSAMYQPVTQCGSMKQLLDAMEAAE